MTEMVDLRELCRRVVALVTFTAGQQKVRLNMTGEDNVPLVQGSADRLQQAILNLVLNSLQALPEGGEVTVETISRGASVDVRVSDDGPGVPSEIRGQLFTIRMTTKPGGTGLGLPLVRLIAENHGGTIRYDDRPGGGATFTLSLPIRDAA
jgi:signal transduction histidine kinase